MQRSQVKIVLLALMLTVACHRQSSRGPAAAVSGVVRDAQGVAQMGALVQVLANDSPWSARRLPIFMDAI